jgi:hypothetical protein
MALLDLNPLNASELEGYAETRFIKGARRSNIGPQTSGRWALGDCGGLPEVVGLDGRFVGARNASRAQWVAPLGRRTVKTEPLPGSLVTITSPRIMRASLREIARPSPVPP